jgi:hypothetical protein
MRIFAKKKMNKFTSFEEFYPYYLMEHRDPLNRLFHYVGSLFVIVLFLMFLVSRMPIFLFLMPIFGYGFAWYGHFKIEKNRPATFKHPFYSLASDFVMLYHFFTFEIDKKIKEAEEKIKTPN